MQGDDRARELYFQQIEDKDREIVRLMDLFDHSLDAVCGIYLV
jgi:hypothetical protein